MKRALLAGLVVLLLSACIEAPPVNPSDPAPDMTEPEPDVSMPEPSDTGTSEPDIATDLDMDTDPVDPPDMPVGPLPFSVEFQADSSFGEVQNLPLFINHFDERFTNWTAVWTSGASEVDRHYQSQKRVEFWAHFPEIGAETEPIQVEFANRRSLVSTTSPWNDFHAIWHMSTGRTIFDVSREHPLDPQGCVDCRTSLTFLGNAMKTKDSHYVLSNPITLTNDWSVTFWVMFDEVNDGSFHVLTLQTDDNSIIFERRSNLLFVSGEQQEETAVPVEVGKWYFVSANSEGQILVNGVDTWVLPTRLAGSLVMTLGNPASPTAFDELWIAKRSFTANEVMTLYKNQNSEFVVSAKALDP